MQECIGKLYSHNGKLTAVKLFDASFLSSPHYIYEVFRVIEGIPLFLEDHLQRLKKTCELAGHCPGFSSSQIQEQTRKLIEANDMQYGNIKIVLHLDAQKQNHQLIYINPHQYPDKEQYQQGVALTLFKGIRHNPNAKIMDVKLRNATNLMKTEKEVYETLLVDKEGCITEGSRSNVFFIRAEKVITPPLQDVLPGITRKQIISICHQLGIELVEEKIPARSVVVMEAAFITGTSRKVLPVNRIDQLEFKPDHPLLLNIKLAFQRNTEQYIKLKQEANTNS